MLANTGTVSIVLYIFFISISVIGMLIAFRYIRKANIDAERTDKMIDLFKVVIITTAIGTVTLIITDLFKEREQDVKELEYFDKYAEDVKKVDGILERLQLTKYLSIVAPSGEMKRSWNQYYDSVKIEYREYLRLKLEKQILDTNKNPTPLQVLQKNELESKIEQKEAPMVTYGTTVGSKKDVFTAKDQESKGFDYLLKKDVVNAINAFKTGENAYNSYHQLYEISKYLKDNESGLLNPNAELWKTAYSKIAGEYSWGMPADIKDKFQKLAD